MVVWWSLFVVRCSLCATCCLCFGVDVWVSLRFFCWLVVVGWLLWFADCYVCLLSVC